MEDLKVCMEQYESCGGKYVREGLSDASVKTARARAQTGMPPSDYAACSDFFPEGGASLATVMQSEAELIPTYDLDRCCSE